MSDDEADEDIEDADDDGMEERLREEKEVDSPLASGSSAPRCLPSTTCPSLTPGQLASYRRIPSSSPHAARPARADCQHRRAVAAAPRAGAVCARRRPRKRGRAPTWKRMWASACRRAKEEVDATNATMACMQRDREDREEQWKAKEAAWTRDRDDMQRRISDLRHRLTRPAAPQLDDAEDRATDQEEKAAESFYGSPPSPLAIPKPVLRFHGTGVARSHPAARPLLSLTTRRPQRSLPRAEQLGSSSSSSACGAHGPASSSPPPPPVGPPPQSGYPPLGYYSSPAPLIGGFYPFAYPTPMPSFSSPMSTLRLATFAPPSMATALPSSATQRRAEAARLKKRAQHEESQLKRPLERAERERWRCMYAAYIRSYTALLDVQMCRWSVVLHTIRIVVRPWCATANDLRQCTHLSRSAIEQLLQVHALTRLSRTHHCAATGAAHSVCRRCEVGEGGVTS